MTKILDASALLAYLEKEPGYEKVRDEFTRAANSGKNLLMASVNWGEVVYIIMREYSEDKAEQIIKLIDTLPIEISSADADMAKLAAYYKAKKAMPYADCFAAALAKMTKGELLTCDNNFRSMENEIKISWIIK
jgi:predicted nucleic acid-binding protein